MAHDHNDLEQLSSMLQQCLGRIDEEAFRIQETGGTALAVQAVERVTEATDELQGLCDSILEVQAIDSHADVNAIVARVAGECLQQLRVPIVQRHDLCHDRAVVSSPSSMVAIAVRRALSIAMAPLSPGGQLSLRTRVDSGSVLLEIESRGCRLAGAGPERAETLREFASDLGGACNVHCDGDDLYLVLQMPQVMVSDQGDRS